LLTPEDPGDVIECLLAGTHLVLIGVKKLWNVTEPVKELLF
jgi:hypothetical protein